MPETPYPQAGTEPQPDPTATPPWGEDFSAEKAWNLIQGLRSDKEKLSSRPVLTDEQKQQLAEYDRLVAASKSDLDRKTDEATRWQGEAERWRAASLSSRIEVLAGQDFADPSDAAAALADPSKYLDAGGVINEEAIKADLAALLEKKPHWRRSDPGTAGPRVPAPNRAQGAGGSPASTPASAFAAAIQQSLNR